MAKPESGLSPRTFHETCPRIVSSDPGLVYMSGQINSRIYFYSVILLFIMRSVFGLVFWHIPEIGTKYDLKSNYNHSGTLTDLDL